MGRHQGCYGPKRMNHEMMMTQQGWCDGACGYCRGIQAPTPASSPATAPGQTSATTSVAMFAQAAPEPARARSPVDDKDLAEKERELDELEKELAELKERARMEEKRKRLDEITAQLEQKRAEVAQMRQMLG